MSASDSEVLLSLLDCPDCLQGRGLVPQLHEDQTYLACGICHFFHPVRDEVAVLLPAARRSGGLRRDLDKTSDLGLERRPARFVDPKALVYSYAARVEELGRVCGLDDRAVVVDVGCSTATLSSWLRPEQLYIGFDISFDSLVFARRGSGQLFVQADAERLPIKTGALPFFVSREVLEHLDNPLAGARELARVGQSGVVVVPTLDFPFLYDPLNWALARLGRRAKFGIYGYGHKELADIAGWRALLEQAGFEVRRERPIGTGLCLNASDVAWHLLYSWRDFDALPRRAAPIALARSLRPLNRAAHGVDSKLLRGAVSHAFAVTA